MYGLVTFENTFGISGKIINFEPCTYFYKDDKRANYCHFLDCILHSGLIT